MARKLIVVALLALAVSVGAFLLFRPIGGPPAERLVVADPNEHMSALLYVAMAKGYADERRLEIVLDRHGSGRQALAATMMGKADIALVAEVPLVITMQAGQPVLVVATIQASDRENAVLARTDARIAGAADLAGRRVGLIPSTSSDYYLTLLLASAGIPQDAINAVPLKPDELAQALIDGRVDAISAFTKMREQAMIALPGATTLITVPNLYTQHWNLAARRETVETRPDAIERLLAALLQAESFVAANPEESIRIVANALSIPEAAARARWEEASYSVGLSQALLINLENLAREEIRRNPEGRMPSMLEALHTEALRRIAPERVSVMR